MHNYNKYYLKVIEFSVELIILLLDILNPLAVSLTLQACDAASTAGNEELA